MEQIELPRSQEFIVTQTYTRYYLHHPGGVGEELAPGTTFQILAPRTSLYHFYHPKIMYPDSNIYKKSLIYTQREFMGGSPQSKPFIEELITKLSKFPASQAPDSNQRAKIKTAFWSAPHDSSLWRQDGGSRQHLTGRQKKRRKRSKIMTPEKKWRLSKKCQREKLSKAMSNLGKMVLKKKRWRNHYLSRGYQSILDQTPFAYFPVPRKV